MNNSNSICFAGPLGNVEIKRSEKGITALSLNSEKQTFENKDMLLQEAKKQVVAYFGHELQTFDLPLDIERPAFFTKVYQEMLKIPYGETVSYSQLAALAGNPKASRAVGMANHTNSIALIVPCHRVIGKDNSLVGFAGGLWRKAALLALENGKEYIENIDKNTERIYSFGLTSPDDFYYDQDRDEFIAMQAGKATLEINGIVIDFSVNDSYFIKAHVKHRVVKTSWDCIWYCEYS